MTASGDQRGNRSDAVFRVGAVLVAVGTIASIATMWPLIVGAEPLPVGFYLACFTAPLGVAVILLALWSRARTRSARLRETSPSPGHHDE